MKRIFCRSCGIATNSTREGMLVVSLELLADGERWTSILRRQAGRQEI